MEVEYSVSELSYGMEVEDSVSELSYVADESVDAGHVQGTFTSCNCIMSRVY